MGNKQTHNIDPKDIILPKDLNIDPKDIILPKDLLTIIFQYTCNNLDDIKYYKKINCYWNLVGLSKTLFKSLQVEIPNYFTNDDLKDFIKENPNIANLTIKNCEKITT